MKNFKQSALHWLYGALLLYVVLSALVVTNTISIVKPEPEKTFMQQLFGGL